MDSGVTQNNAINLIPVLRSIAQVTNQGNRRWKIEVDPKQLSQKKITLDGIIKFLTALQAVIITAFERNIALVEIPSSGEFFTYLKEAMDKYLTPYQPRHLTEKEINDIISALPSILSSDSYAATVATEQVHSATRQQLSEIIITPLAIPDLRNFLIHKLERAKISAGETVGLTVAEAIAALTQAALNFKHRVGASTITSGIDMLRELLFASVKRKDPLCYVHFKNKALNFEQVYRKKNEIVSVTISSLIVDSDTLPIEELVWPWWLTLYNQLATVKLPKATDVTWIKFDTNRMYSFGITLLEIAQLIREEVQIPRSVIVIPGPSTSGEMYIFPTDLAAAACAERRIQLDFVSRCFLVDYFMPVLKNKLIRGIPDIVELIPASRMVWGAVEDEIRLSESDWRLEFRRTSLLREGIPFEKIVWLLTEAGYDMVELDQENVPPTYLIIRSAQIKSKPSEYINKKRLEAEKIVDQRRKDLIKAEKIRQQQRQLGKPVDPLPETITDTNTYIVENSWYYYAIIRGNNLVDILKRRDVDTRKTSTNNPFTILSLAGIEAAGNVLNSEFNFILENASVSLDPRHIPLLVDFMTSRGTILATTRWGMTRLKSDPFTAATFSQAVDSIKHGAAFGITEDVKTISMSMYMGKQAGIGSYYSTVIPKEMEEEINKMEEGDAPSATDFAAGIDQLNNLNFTTEQPPDDPLANLMKFATAKDVPAPTKVGTATVIPPKASPKAAPVVPDLLSKSMDSIRDGPATEEADVETVRTTVLRPPIRVISRGRPSTGIPQARIVKK